MRSAILFILPALLTAGPLGCDSPPQPADVPRAGGTDVTFFVTADTHLGHPGMAAANRRLIEAMHALPGMPYPPEIGGVVAVPRGVLIAGDLTEDGRNDPGARQWDTFVRLYGLLGGDGLLKYPVYEATGNHDRYVPARFGRRRHVLEAVRRRHGALTYAVDWADLHVACLDMYPDAAGCRWLAEDLAATGVERPVVIFFHYNIKGPHADAWSDREKDAFAETIRPYNVVGIFHGHWHGTGQYRWAGRDVYNVGVVKSGTRSFAVVRITDTVMTVAYWDWESKSWDLAHRKGINGAPDPAPPATRTAPAAVTP